MEVVAVRPTHEIPRISVINDHTWSVQTFVLSITADIAFKLVKKTFLVVEIHELGPNVVVNIDNFNGLRVHVDIPHF